MALISNKNFILDDEEDLGVESYTLPDLVTSKPEAISFWKKSVSGSVFLHVVVPVLIWLISIILLLMGINLSLFNKVKPQPKRDIEFVLVDKPGKPRDPNTKNRADIDSRSGGVNDPKRKVSMPSPKPQKQSKPSAPANRVVKQQVKQQAQQVQPKPQSQPQLKPVQQLPKVEQPAQAKPAPPSPRPSTRPATVPPPVAKPTTAFNIPAPKAAPVGKNLSTGPVGGTSAPTGVSNGKTGGPVTSSGAYAPRPSLSPSASSSGSQLSRGSSTSGTGNVGNPGGGGGAPGIDALREPDFGPYMRELQRRIKLNWDPPKGNESKTVVLLFKIARDGRLISCRVHRSSGLPTADQAALKAVELTAPFRPLPGDFKGQSIDIQFTFDYRVFGASRY